MDELITENPADGTVTVCRQFSLLLLEDDRSSLVRAAGYDDGAGVLLVQLKDRKGEPAGVYRYLAVPEFHHAELLEAESVGNYYNTRIKPFFHCEQLDEATGRWYAAGWPERAAEAGQADGRRKNYYAVTGWSVADIVAAFARAGRTVTEAFAADWLDANEGKISDRLTEEGWEVIAALI